MVPTKGDCGGRVWQCLCCMHGDGAAIAVSRSTVEGVVVFLRSP